VSSASRGLLQRRLPVPFVHEVEVDPVGPQPPQAVLAGADQVPARYAAVVRAVAHAEACLGGDQHSVALVAKRLADDRLGRALRVDVGGVEHVDARIERHVDQPARPGHVRRPGLGEKADTAKGHRAERQDRQAQAGTAELTIFHLVPPKCEIRCRALAPFGGKGDAPGRRATAAGVFRPL